MSLCAILGVVIAQCGECDEAVGPMGIGVGGTLGAAMGLGWAV